MSRPLKLHMIEWAAQVAHTLSRLHKISFEDARLQVELQETIKSLEELHRKLDNYARETGL